jgi:hypothetical protein
MVLFLSFVNFIRKLFKFQSIKDVFLYLQISSTQILACTLAAIQYSYCRIQTIIRNNCLGIIECFRYFTNFTWISFINSAKWTVGSLYIISPYRKYQITTCIFTVIVFCTSLVLIINPEAFIVFADTNDNTIHISSSPSSFSVWFGSISSDPAASDSAVSVPAASATVPKKPFHAWVTEADWEYFKDAPKNLIILPNGDKIDYNMLTPAQQARWEEHKIDKILERLEQYEIEKKYFKWSMIFFYLAIVFFHYVYKERSGW